MSADSFAIFRLLIKDYKNDEMSYSSFCEYLEEYSELESSQEDLVLGLSNYLENLPTNNMADLKLLDFDEKSELSEAIYEFVKQFLGYEPL